MIAAVRAHAAPMCRHMLTTDAWQQPQKARDRRRARPARLQAPCAGTCFTLQMHGWTAWQQPSSVAAHAKEAEALCEEVQCPSRCCRSV